SFDEALLWIREWGIWPGSEDWPRFYGARGTHGERNALEDKPGHLFTPSDQDDFRLFLLIMLENGWGGDLLSLRDGKLSPRIWISHDGWAELHANAPMPFTLNAS